MGNGLRQVDVLVLRQLGLQGGRVVLKLVKLVARDLFANPQFALGRADPGAVLLKQRQSWRWISGLLFVARACCSRIRVSNTPDTSCGFGSVPVIVAVPPVTVAGALVVLPGAIRPNCWAA